jgi:SAM-dependent methyltransferase
MSTAAAGVGGQTFLARRPDLWRRLFRIDPRRARFVSQALGGATRSVLDVGCATGELCAALATAGLRATGVDVNPWFIRAAAAAFPDVGFRVADMRALPFRGRFDGLACVGSTLLYARSNAALARTLRSFHRALRPGGRLLVDVLNASALIARRPFRRRTVHRFPRLRLAATIHHSVDEAAQVLTERVSWTEGARRHEDPPSRLRLLFPQELAHFLEGAGFADIEILGDFRRGSRALHGRRMVVLARRASR